MVVVLDTNIIIQKPKMDTEIYQILFNYLERTESYLLMPDIVYKELPVIFAKRLKEEFEKYSSYAKQIKSQIHNAFEIAPLDIGIETRLFIENIDAIYSRYNSKYKIGHDLEMLEETVRRAIYKIKPCSEEREEFRDTLVWLTVINAALQQEENNIVFISSNTKDFCKPNGELHEHLIEDLRQRDIVVHFYKSLDDFIKEHAKMIEGIDRDRVMRITEQVNTEVKLLKILEKRYMTYFEHVLERKYDYVQDVELLDRNIELDDFHVYEMKDDTYLLVVDFMTSISVQAEVESDDDSFYDYDDQLRHRRRRIDREIESEIKIQYLLNEAFDVINWDVLDIEDL